MPNAAGSILDRMDIERMNRNRDKAAERTDSGPERAGSATTSWRTGRWVALIYVIVALGAPLLLYAGPDSMSPAAPLIADKALDGELTMRIHAFHAHASEAANPHR